jgi:hypothetical protein
MRKIEKNTFFEVSQAVLALLSDMDRLKRLNFV